MQTTTGLLAWSFGANRACAHEGEAGCGPGAWRLPTKDRRAGRRRANFEVTEPSHGSERGKGRDEIWRAGCAVGRTACENLDHAAGEKTERLTNVPFSTTVGEIVPGTVHLYSLPVSILEYAPQYRDYEYILVGDEILIVDPRTLRIVAVIAA